MKQKKYLALYKEWLETGMIGKAGSSYNGMCCLFPNDALFDLFLPTSEERRQLYLEGVSETWWGAGDANLEYGNELWGTFTSLRQTILLFMAALNEEL